MRQSEHSNQGKKEKIRVNRDSIAMGIAVIALIALIAYTSSRRLEIPEGIRWGLRIRAAQSAIQESPLGLRTISGTEK